jgi:DNA-binding LytR/AlgR family response regulator
MNSMPQLRQTTCKSMILRPVIVDDDPLARDFLQMLLAEHGDIEVVAQCQNGQEAVSYLQSKPSDRSRRWAGLM